VISGGSQLPLEFGIYWQAGNPVSVFRPPWILEFFSY
jgi:hypothetical protein